MTLEQESSQNLPPIVEPREFLDRPFIAYEVGRLPSSPTVAFLQWLPTLKTETGLGLIKPHWFVVKASEMGVPSYLMPAYSDVLIHSHPKADDEEKEPGHIPSAGDFHNCSETAVNLLVSEKGITRYWKPEDDRDRRSISQAIFNETYSKDVPSYLGFLKSVNARFEVYSWEEVGETKLTELFEGK